MCMGISITILLYLRNWMGRGGWGFAVFICYDSVIVIIGEMKV